MYVPSDPHCTLGSSVNTSQIGLRPLVSEPAGTRGQSIPAGFLWPQECSDSVGLGVDLQLFLLRARSDSLSMNMAWSECQRLASKASQALKEPSCSELNGSKAWFF